MNHQVFITCAVTGGGATTQKSDKIPITPREIADAAIESAKAGAAIAHCHVRDPETGAQSRDLSMYKEVVDRIRDADTDLIINLTAGTGGDLTLGSTSAPLPPNAESTDLVSSEVRVQHIKESLPEMCTLDCGTMNFGDGDYIMINTPAMLRDMAARMTALGVRPEIEVFDAGHLWFAKQLVKEGLISDPVLIQLCMGVPWGAPSDLNTFMAMVNNVPDNWIFSAFSIGQMQLPYVAAAVLAGGNVRVGLEDNIYLKKGELATNSQLVDRAVTILEAMNVQIVGPDEVRKKLKLRKV